MKGCFGSSAKALGVGLSARAGFESAILAQSGHTGPLGILDDAQGLLALQNVNRFSRRVYDSRHYSEPELGYLFIGEAQGLIRPRGYRWNDFFPKPGLHSDKAAAGDVFFFRAIEWILAHEIGHVALAHGNRAWTAQQSRDEEREADDFATRYVIADLTADGRREAGEKPSGGELELERRAIAAGLGLIWVAMFEDTRTQESDMYPPVAERIDRAMAAFGLATALRSKSSPTSSRPG
jgi:hypothetical protein